MGRLTPALCPGPPLHDWTAGLAASGEGGALGYLAMR